MAPAKTSVKGTTQKELNARGSERLAGEELDKIDAYWRACNYLAAGMIYLRENPLLREPLKPEHIKTSAAGPLGRESGFEFHLRSSQPPHQQV